MARPAKIKKEGEHVKCPLCNGDLIEGGLVIWGNMAGWVPIDQLDKKWGRYSDWHSIARPTMFLSNIKIPYAFFCEDCNKIIGVFDVVKD